MIYKPLKVLPVVALLTAGALIAAVLGAFDSLFARLPGGEESLDLVEAAGLEVVMDRCPAIELRSPGLSLRS